MLRNMDAEPPELSARAGVCVLEEPIELGKTKLWNKLSAELLGAVIGVRACVAVLEYRMLSSLSALSSTPFFTS